MGKHSYEGLAALDQLLAAMTSPTLGERNLAMTYGRMYLIQLGQSEPDQAVIRVYQALQLLAEKEAKNEPPPRLPPDQEGEH
jgi:hypothetical protein